MTPGQAAKLKVGRNGPSGSMPTQIRPIVLLMTPHRSIHVLRPDTEITRASGAHRTWSGVL